MLFEVMISLSSKLTINLQVNFILWEGHTLNTHNSFFTHT